jgi:hypothetical protein
VEEAAVDHCLERATDGRQVEGECSEQRGLLRQRRARFRAHVWRRAVDAQHVVAVARQVDGASPVP